MAVKFFAVQTLTGQEQPPRGNALYAEKGDVLSSALLDDNKNEVPTYVPEDSVPENVSD